MHAFSSSLVIECLDALACGLLAAAAACRAKKLGAPIFGVLVTGCLCGFAGAFFRELLLHGHAGVLLILRTSPVNALFGSFFGLLCAFFIKSAKVFLWLDAVALGLASSMGCALAISEAEIGAAITVGLANGLLPGIIRDAVLGDTPLAIEKNWCSASAFIACLVAILILLLPALWRPLEFVLAYIGEAAVLGGTITAMIIWLWGADKDI